jgi:hypothetical protein
LDQILEQRHDLQWDVSARMIAAVSARVYQIAVVTELATLLRAKIIPWAVSGGALMEGNH